MQTTSKARCDDSGHYHVYREASLDTQADHRREEHAARRRVPSLLGLKPRDFAKDPLSEHGDKDKQQGAKPGEPLASPDEALDLLSVRPELFACGFALLGLGVALWRWSWLSGF